MSIRYFNLSVFENSIVEGLDSGDKLYDGISKILELDERNAKRIIEGTSKTAYRRIHEIFASTLDRISNIKRDEIPQRINEIVLLLSKAKILIEYQSARRQINNNLARLLLVIVRKLNEYIKNPNKHGELKEVVERARTFLDALAVLVYRYGR